MQRITVDFTSCGFVRLATYESRVADVMSSFAFICCGMQGTAVLNLFLGEK